MSNNAAPQSIQPKGASLPERLRVGSCRYAHETQDDAAMRRIRTDLEAAARIEKLEAALRQIKAKTEGHRPTVNPENAFGHWSNLNAALVIIRGLARAALEAKP